MSAPLPTSDEVEQARLLAEMADLAAQRLQLRYKSSVERTPPPPLPTQPRISELTIILPPPRKGDGAFGFEFEATESPRTTEQRPRFLQPLREGTVQDVRPRPPESRRPSRPC